MLILTHGTRGDVQPYTALALALRQAGHQPVPAAPAAMASLAEPYGLTFAPLHDGPNTLMDDPWIREAIETNYRGWGSPLGSCGAPSRSWPACSTTWRPPRRAGRTSWFMPPAYRASISPNGSPCRPCRRRCSRCGCRPAPFPTRCSRCRCPGR
ncbi:glycosyltransferase [Nonomuraea fuscirosea]|uniref:glycosyltransferase n=1 Tax=Nonomuraea fuscirosea TaxID=1291556 RepID=UPI003430E65F